MIPVLSVTTAALWWLAENERLSSEMDSPEALRFRMLAASATHPDLELSRRIWAAVETAVASAALEVLPYETAR